MSTDIRSTNGPSITDAGRYDALLARAQSELSAIRTATRLCPLCGDKIRGGQELRRMHGTTVHAHCMRRRDPDST